MIMTPMQRTTVEQCPVSVKGVDLIVEQPRSRRGARFLRGGEELPRDRWGNTLLIGADGLRHQVEVGYNLLHLSPTVRVDDQREAIILMPFSKGVRNIWMAMMVLGAVGTVGNGFLLGGAFGAACILSRHRPGRASVMQAVALMLVALVLQSLRWTGVIGPFFG
jgi:hypothetical protein